MNYKLTVSDDMAFPLAYESTCIHCGRRIIKHSLDGWVDPEAGFDIENGDGMWRETCDANDTERAAPHEPEVRGCSCGMADYGAPGHDGGPEL